MDRGDYSNNSNSNYGGGGGYEQDGGRRRKRSFDDASGGGGGGGGDRQDQYDPRNSNNGGGDDNGGGYNKRARYDDRGNSNYRPRDNNYRRGGGGDDDRYGGGRSRYGGNNDSGGRGGRFDRYSSGGGANGESDRARAWRLTKKAIVELGEVAQLGDDVQGGAAMREHLQDAATKVLAELEASDEEAKLNHISALTLRCAGKLAHKTSLYAVLVGLINEKKPAFGRKVVDATVAHVQSDFDFFISERYAEVQEKDDDPLRKERDVTGVALRVRLLVRFLGELVSTRVLKGEDLLAMLDTLQAVCTPDDFNAESDVSLRVREDAAAFKDFLASVVLDTLLHVRPLSSCCLYVCCERVLTMCVLL